MGYYWFSFSKDGQNQGCINTEAETSEKAKNKLKGLSIIPEHDDVKVWKIPRLEISPDVLVSKKGLIEQDYRSVKEKACFCRRKTL